jgi:DNA-directed RNA polymerase I, II, and III subunit RPABC2
MSKKNTKEVAHLDEEEDQVEIDEEDEVYDDDEDEVDVDITDRDEAKPTVPDDDDEDDEEDDGEDSPIPHRRHHIYHQVVDSTEIKIVSPDRRTTSEYMTIYEYSMVVGTRATHISEGSILYTDPQGLFDPRDIAKKEINENKCPLSITRKVSPSMIEVWEVNEMIKPPM